VKRAIDIERLLTWAYREELVKRTTSSAEALWGRLGEWQSLGVAYDLDRSVPQRYDLGVPDPDAELIEREAGQLKDAHVDWEREGWARLGSVAALIHPVTKQNAPAATRRAMASWSNRRGVKVRVEVEPPRQVLLVRSQRTAALVIMHANIGTRPNWVNEQARPYPVPAERGTNPKIVGECRGRHRYVVGSYCPLRWEPSPIWIAEQRAEYLAWWRGLDTLALMLGDRLARFFPTRPAAPEMPWLR
jgi:hypothetical protein